MFCCNEGVRDYKNGRSRGVDAVNDDKIKEFMAWDRSGALSESMDRFAIQVVTKENFGPTLNVEWYRRKVDGFELDETGNCSGEFQRANCFKNFTCKQHARFFELNLYTPDAVSQHHESTRSGCTYARDASLDQHTGVCIKGKRWHAPAE